MFAVRPVGLVKSAFVWRPTISSDVTNWVLNTQAIAAGWDGTTPLDAVVTVGSGIVLSANSTSLYGFDTGSGFPAGSTLALIMPGYIIGMGGAGSNGAGYLGSAPAGSPGGPALRAQHAITIDATGGVIGGGGGGGGGGVAQFSSFQGGGGGGGRTGRIGSVAGSNSGTGLASAVAGSFSVGGAGGIYTSATGGTTGPGTTGYDSGSGNRGGGGGGGWGAAGGAGGGSGAAGGAGGAAVVGNSYITWINTGTRYGAIT